MLAALRLKFAVLSNHFLRRKGPSLRDQCASVIMHTCSLQLERSELRELAPTKGATGPMLLSGGGITTISYSVFDTEADKIDPVIRKEPWRAFSKVTMRLTLEQDPQFEVTIEEKKVEARACHKNPGLALIKNLSAYFPLLARPHHGPTYIPGEVA